MAFTKENWFRIGTLSANFLMLALSYTSASKHDREIAALRQQMQTNAIEYSVIKSKLEWQDHEIAALRQQM